MLVEGALFKKLQSKGMMKLNSIYAFIAAQSTTKYSRTLCYVSDLVPYWYLSPFRKGQVLIHPMDEKGFPKAEAITNRIAYYSKFTKNIYT